MQPKLVVCLLLASFAMTSGQIRRRFKLDNNIRRTSKTRGVNGGNLYFDEASGEFKKRPEHHHEREESAEVIARTRMKNFDNGNSDRTVNKVLKRRKKYKKLPVQVAHLVNKKEETESEESEFTKLPPLKNKYKASDTIRMHLGRTDDAKNEEISSPRRKTKPKVEHNQKEYKDENSDRNLEYMKPDRSSQYVKPDYRNQDRDLDYRKPDRSAEYVKPYRNSGYVKPQRTEVQKLKEEPKPIKRKNEYRGRNNLKRDEGTDIEKDIKIESRENVYEYYDRPEDVLLTSGYHNQLSVQDPNYDFTIGDTQKTPSAPADPILNHQFFPTRPPLKYPAYPGLYFPPTSNEEDKNALKNYDFTIGDTGNPTALVNPVLHYLNNSPKQPARLPTTPKPFFPTRSNPQTTSIKVTPQPTKASRRSHTTESHPATGHRFPHFPSIEITDNYIDSFTARKGDTKKYKDNQKIDFKTYKQSYTTTTRRPRNEQQLKTGFYNGFGSQNYETTRKPYKKEQLKPNYYDDFGPAYPTDRPNQYGTNGKYTTSQSRNYYTTQQPKEYARTYQTTVRSPDPYEKENTASEQFNSFGSSNFFSSNNNDFFSDWGKKVDPSENSIKREIGKGFRTKTTTKPKIKQPANEIQTKAVDDEIYQLKNYRTPVGAYPGMYNNANNQGYNDRVTAAGYTTSSYQQNDIKSKYTSYPAPNTQTTPTTIFTNTHISYTPAPAVQHSRHIYTPIPAVYQNTPRSYIGQPTPKPIPRDFVTQRSHSPSPSNYGHHTTSNPKKLKRGPLKKELSGNPQKKRKNPIMHDFGNRFNSGFSGFGPNHIKPHQPAITFLEPSSTSPPDDRYQTQPRPVPTQDSPARNSVNVFNQPAAFDRFFEFSNFDQRNMPGETFSQFGQGAPGAQRQQPAANQHHSQYYQQGLRPQDNFHGNQNLDVREELPRRKRNKQQTSLKSKGKRKRKTAQFDNRPQGGYSINVFNNAGKNYSIFDGNFNKNVEPTFGNSNNPERQHDAMNKPRQFKRNIGQQGLRTDNSNPWPNDKHWTNQQYESQELGDHIPFLF